MFLEIGLLVAHDRYEGQAPSAGVVIGLGKIEGRPAVIFVGFPASVPCKIKERLQEIPLLDICRPNEVCLDRADPFYINRPTWFTVEPILNPPIGRLRNLDPAGFACALQTGC